MRIIVFVGLPGAGKSTKAKEFESQGYVVHSPDAIRNKYNLHKKEDINEVLSILNNNLINDLQQGKDIIYDSTNLTATRRRTILEMIPEGYEKICEVFITSIDMCKSRNANRVGYSKITETEYRLMINSYHFPTSDEGWDKIVLYNQDEKVIFEDDAL